MTPNSPFRSNLSVRQNRNSPFRRPGSPSSRPSSVIAPPSPSSPHRHPDLAQYALSSPPSQSRSPSRTSDFGPRLQRSDTHSNQRNFSIEPPAPLFASRESLREISPSNSRHSLSSSTMSQRTTGPETGKVASQTLGHRKSNAGTSQLRATSPLKLKSSMADPLAFIPPAQLHTMRESFTVLDRSNSGVITAADVADMLGQLGMESTPAVLKHFFPSGVKEMNLAGYLSSLAGPLVDAALESELREALAAFDDDDSGQIDVTKLKTALSSTVPENGEAPLSVAEIDDIMQPFSVRRAFTRHRGGSSEHRGQVFKYEDFLNSMYATAPNSGTPTQASSEGRNGGR